MSGLDKHTHTQDDYRNPRCACAPRVKKVCRVLMHLFGVVQAHRTSSDLLEPHHYSDSKVFRVLSHEFGVVRLYRTFSIYIVARETRCAGCLCTCSGWFKHIEPRRTFPNYIITEIARCVEFCLVARTPSALALVDPARRGRSNVSLIYLLQRPRVSPNYVRGALVKLSTKFPIHSLRPRALECNYSVHHVAVSSLLWSKSRASDRCRGTKNITITPA